MTRRIATKTVPPRRVAARHAEVPCPCGSGKKFTLCHGAPALPSAASTTAGSAQPGGWSASEAAIIAAGAAPALQMAAPRNELRLDLACGQNPMEGFEGVDLWFEGAKHRVDLTKYPWPWADNSVAEIHCSHYVEHIPMEYLEGGPHAGEDAFFAFFDECYRIIVPDGFMTVIVPALQSVRAFQDPTHRRFLPMEAFLYLFKDWRVANKLDHYKVKCNFGCTVSPSIPVEFNSLNPEVQARRMREGWNIMIDLHAKLKAIK